MQTTPKALITWHQLFLGVAQLAALRSKDPVTKNGACIVSSDHRILGVGYNGLPRGCDDGDPVYWSDNDDDPFLSRHSYVVHAEINAILNCVVLPPVGSSIFVTQFPCPSCAQAIIQAGVRFVIYQRKKEHHGARILATEKMFAAAGVALTNISIQDPPTAKWVDALQKHIPKIGGTI